MKRIKDMCALEIIQEFVECIDDNNNYSLEELKQLIFDKMVKNMEVGIM